MWCGQRRHLVHELRETRAKIAQREGTRRIFRQIRLDEPREFFGRRATVEDGATTEEITPTREKICASPRSEVGPRNPTRPQIDHVLHHLIDQGAATLERL